LRLPVATDAAGRTADPLAVAVAVGDAAATRAGDVAVETSGAVVAWPPDVAGPADAAGDRDVDEPSVAAEATDVGVLRNDRKREAVRPRAMASASNPLVPNQPVERMNTHLERGTFDSGTVAPAAT
jgi:hypothetical protein